MPPKLTLVEVVQKQLALEATDQAHGKVVELEPELRYTLAHREIPSPELWRSMNTNTQALQKEFDRLDEYKKRLRAAIQANDNTPAANLQRHTIPDTQARIDNLIKMKRDMDSLHERLVNLNEERSKRHKKSLPKAREHRDKAKIEAVPSRAKNYSANVDDVSDEDDR